MTLTPILQALLAVRLHVITVLPAFVIGTYLIFISRKGAPLHRALGYLYLVLMTVTAADALFIHILMPNGPLYGLSPIHLFSALTLFGVVSAFQGARKHNIAQHRYSMLGVYIGGILIAGILAFLPGRIMHAVMFGH